MPSRSHHLIFGPFRLDPIASKLWREEEEIAIRPRPLALLTYLATHPDQVVSKADLLQHIWPDTYVSDTVVRVCIREIRQALGTAGASYIQTETGAGYRFTEKQEKTSPEAISPPQDTPPAPLIVGRETELSQLQQWLNAAEQGRRQIVFVTGEPGIGKTTLADMFLTRVRATSRLRIGRGQCVEQYGAGEGYLPILEALSRLGQEPGGVQLVSVLQQYAPTWLVQLPALLSTAERAALQPQVQGATPDRMLRELAEALEALTAERGFVLLLEDLHWSDLSTLALVSYLAQRREAARLFVLGTYRPADIIVNEHPLHGAVQELQVHHQCNTLPLELFSENTVAHYMTERLPHTLSETLPQQIHQLTDGNALFMVTLIEYCLQQGLLVERSGQWELTHHSEHIGVPDGLRPLIEKQIGHLTPAEQQLLEVASVVGTEFDATAVAAGLKQEVDEIDALCERLASTGQVVEERGVAEWPDGSLSGQYGFRHALYQNVLYERTAMARRMRLHRTIGERIESGYGEDVKELASELALHFERGRDLQRAIQYYQQAGEVANQHSAYQEAAMHFTSAITHLLTQPETPQRDQSELLLQTDLGQTLMNAQGYVSEEARQAFSRAHTLSQRVADSPQLPRALTGLWFFYLGKCELKIAATLAEQILQLGQNDPGSLAHQVGLFTLGDTWFWQGAILDARMSLEQSLAASVPKRSSSSNAATETYKAMASIYLAMSLWVLGFPEQALRKSQDALQAAQEAVFPGLQAFIRFFTLWLHQLCGEWRTIQDQVSPLLAFHTEYGLNSNHGWGDFLQGWALEQQGQATEGTAQMRIGLAAAQDNDLLPVHPHLMSVLAETLGKTQQVEAGLELATEALAFIANVESHTYEAELCRVKGNLVLQRGKSQPTIVQHVEEEAEDYFQKALRIARRQEAKSWELRAAMSLSRLWQQQGRAAEARQLLADTFAWFTEGFDTADLQEAKALLDELGASPSSPPFSHS